MYWFNFTKYLWETLLLLIFIHELTMPWKLYISILKWHYINSLFIMCSMISWNREIYSDWKLFMDLEKSNFAGKFIVRKGRFKGKGKKNFKKSANWRSWTQFMLRFGWESGILRPLELTGGKNWIKFAITNLNSNFKYSKFCIFGPCSREF